MKCALQNHRWMMAKVSLYTADTVTRFVTDNAALKPILPELFRPCLCTPPEAF